MACQYAAAILNKRRKEFVLDRSKVDRLSIAAELTAAEVDFHLAEPVRLAGIPSTGAAENCLDARAEFHRTEGFDDVVVGAELQPEHFFGFLRPGGQKNDRRLDAAVAQLA